MFATFANGVFVNPTADNNFAGFNNMLPLISPIPNNSGFFSATSITALASVLTTLFICPAALKKSPFEIVLYVFIFPPSPYIGILRSDQSFTASAIDDNIGPRTCNDLVTRWNGVFANAGIGMLYNPNPILRFGVSAASNNTCSVSSLYTSTTAPASVLTTSLIFFAAVTKSSDTIVLYPVTFVPLYTGILRSDQSFTASATAESIGAIACNDLTTFWNGVLAAPGIGMLNNPPAIFKFASGTLNISGFSSYISTIACASVVTIRLIFVAAFGKS